MPFEWEKIYNSFVSSTENSHHFTSIGFDFYIVPQEIKQIRCFWLFEMCGFEIKVVDSSE